MTRIALSCAHDLCWLNLYAVRFVDSWTNRLGMGLLHVPMCDKGFSPLIPLHRIWWFTSFFEKKAGARLAWRDPSVFSKGCVHYLPTFRKKKSTIHPWIGTPIVPWEPSWTQWGKVVYQKGKASATRDLFCVARGVVRVVQANVDSISVLFGNR